MEGIDNASVVNEIAEVNAEIDGVRAEIREAAEVAATSATDEDKRYWRTIVLKLLDEKKQLLEKELLLRQLLIRLPPATTGSASGEADDAYLKRAKGVTTPSQVIASQEQIREEGPLIKNWRPTASTAAGQLPELSHPVFAQVVDKLADGSKPDKESIDAAGDMCELGAQFYGNEAKFTKAVRARLVRFLEVSEGVVTAASHFVLDSEARPDWALCDRDKKPTNVFLICEVKTGIGGSGDSHYQGANYYMKFWATRDDNARFTTSCCPAFLLEVVGPHVRLSSLAWLDRVTVFPLTPLYNLLPAHPHTDCLVEPVARLLEALRMGVHELAKPDAALPKLHPHAKKLALPWPIALNPRYKACTSQRLAPHTYYVELSDGGVPVVVKLCRRGYGVDAHKAWADAGLAPKVLLVHTVPGGWQHVEMEYLPKGQWTPLDRLPAADRSQALEAAVNCLRDVHRVTAQQGGVALVHGDVRPPNCLLRRGQGEGDAWDVCFVDFEWSGPDGTATYPAFLNPVLPWPDGVDYNLPLLAKHDEQLLRASLAIIDDRSSTGMGPAVQRALPSRPPCGASPGVSRPPLLLLPGTTLRRGLGWRRWPAGCVGRVGG